MDSYALKAFNSHFNYPTIFSNHRLNKETIGEIYVVLSGKLEKASNQWISQNLLQGTTVAGYAVTLSSLDYLKTVIEFINVLPLYILVYFYLFRLNLNRDIMSKTIINHYSGIYGNFNVQNTI